MNFPWIIEISGQSAEGPGGHFREAQGMGAHSSPLARRGLMQQATPNQARCKDETCTLQAYLPGPVRHFIYLTK